MPRSQHKDKSNVSTGETEQCLPVSKRGLWNSKFGLPAGRALTPQSKRVSLNPIFDGHVDHRNGDREERLRSKGSRSGAKIGQVISPFIAG